MTSLSRQKIFEKLENLEEYLGYLRQLRKEAARESLFLSDFHLFGNTERYLQLSIQTAVDILHLIILDLGMERPLDNYEAISLLYGKKIIQGKLANTLTHMVGLRNILVHEYGKIDRKKVYRVLKKELSDFKTFKEQIARFLGRPKKSV